MVRGIIRRAYVENLGQLGVQLITTLKEWWSHVRVGILWGLGFSLVLSLLGIFVVAGMAYFPALRYRHAYMPKSDAVIPVNATETKTLNQLVSRGIVISAGDVYNDTLSYYNTLISWLIGLVGMSALIGFIYVRGRVGEEAELVARKAVDDFFSKETTHRLLEEKVRAATEELEELEALRAAVEQLGERVEFIEAAIPRFPAFREAQTGVGGPTATPSETQPERPTSETPENPPNAVEQD